MDVTLSPELEEMVREHVASGLYRDPEDVVRHALKSLDRDPAAKEEALRAAIQLGLDDLEAGRVTVINNREELEALFRDL